VFRAIVRDWFVCLPKTNTIPILTVVKLAPSLTPPPFPPILAPPQSASRGGPTSHFGQENVGAEDLALLCTNNEPLNKSKQCRLLDQQKMQSDG
jgi:hypothetical protein